MGRTCIVYLVRTAGVEQLKWMFVMFDTLSDRLSGIFDGITGRGALSESDVNKAMREIRRALIEADVSLEVVKAFIEQVKVRAIGSEVTRSIKPGQQVVKIVHDELVAVLGTDAEPIDLGAASPVGIMMVGLQGSGKTTTTAKLARWLKEKENKKVLMASLDIRRPAAMEQLKVLGAQVGVDVLPIIEGQQPVEIAKRAEQDARLLGYDILMLDTAGRTHIDDELMLESADICAATNPHEILLVVDALTGQDAINVARSFDDRVDISGIVMTRMDGDGRGGAALSMRAATGKPIKLIGVGEKMEALENFHPSRIADRILGMGDVVSLVEKAAEAVDAKDAERMAEKLKKGKFDLQDLADQLGQMKKLGGMGGLMGMMPGMGKVKKQLAGATLDDSMFDSQVAIINSMTKKERAQPKLLNASRRKRIAAGSGTSVQQVNKLIKMHRQMADMMKKVSKGGMGGLADMFGGIGAHMPGGDHIPPGSAASGGVPDEAQLENMRRQMMQAGLDPSLLDKTGGGVEDAVSQASAKAHPDHLPPTKPSLPGLGGDLPSFPHLPGLGGTKKK